MRIGIFILLIICVDLTTEIVHLEKIRSENDRFETRLIYYTSKRLVNEIKFVNFEDFKAIKFWNFNVSRYKYMYNIINVGFVPKKKVLLDLEIKNVDFWHFIWMNVYINFFYVRGLDVDSFNLSFYSSSPSKPREVWIFFSLANFILFKNGKILNDNAACQRGLFRSDRGYFTNVNNLYFHYGTKYSQTTCKFIFINAKVENVYFDSVTDSFVKNNQLGFIPAHNATINSRIKWVYFNVYRIKVNARMLDKDVFERVEDISFRGVITQIDDDSFQMFNHLYLIRLIVLNLRQLFSRGIEWMNRLGNVQVSNVSNITEMIEKINFFTIVYTFDANDINSGSLQKPYLYPDEDFCSFANFPFERLVFLDPQMYCVNNCSCTQYWLLQYAIILNQSNETLANLKFLIQGVLQFDDYGKEIEKCDFPRRLENCKTKARWDIDQEPSFTSALVLSQTVDFVIVILTPILGILGIVVNSVNIKTIVNINLNKSPEDMQQKTLMRFMLAYSIVNLAYCVIHSLSLISKCVELDSLFCPDLYFTQFAQWFKIILVEFLAGILKTFSNGIYFCISVSRYILLEKESKLAVLINGTIGEWSRKKKTIWLIFISTVLIALNAHKIVIYKVVNYSIGNALADKYPEYFFSLPFFLSNSKIYEHEWNYLTTREVRDRSTVYEVLTYVNFLLNDVCFYLLFTVVDILLVIGFNKATEKKKNFYRGKLNDEKIDKLLTNMEQNGKRIMRVIIVNTCILLVIKVFDLFITVAKFRIWKENLNSIDQKRKLNDFCHTVKICSVYEELVNIVYMFHYCFSIVCFYHLNKNFKANIINMFRCNQH